MGFLKNLFHLFTAVNLTEEYGPGAGILYSEIVGERESRASFSKQKKEALDAIQVFLRDERKFLNESLVSEIVRYAEKIKSADVDTVQIYAGEMNHFLQYKCAFFAEVNNLMQNAVDAINSLSDDDLDSDDRERINLRIKQIRNSSDAEEVKRLYLGFFDYLSENGVTVENADEMLEKFRKIESETIANWA